MKHLKKFWLLLIFSLLSTTVIILACSGGDWDDSEGSLFTPEIINQNDLKPFFRSPYLPFYGEEPYYQNHNTAFNSLNVKEWQSYFDKKTDTNALNFWLYQSTLKDIDAMILTIQKKQTTLSDSAKKYSIANLEPSNKSSAFLFYLGFARRNESFSLNDLSFWGWGDQKKEPDQAFLLKQIEGGMKLFTNSNTAFIKERYLFQLVRLYYFSKQYDEAIAFYKKNENILKTGNSMKWRTIGYVAASHYKKQNYAEANYIYSLIFSEFPAHKKSAYLSFHPQENKDWEQCLSLAKTPKEKINLWLLFGMYFDAPRAMDEIYKIDPKSEVLELLLVRTVNAEEQKLNQSIFLSYKNSVSDNLENKPDEKTIKLITSVASENKTAHPAIWQLAAAYFNYAAKNPTLADNFLKQAEKSKNTSDIYFAQYHLINLYGKLIQAKNINSDLEKNCLPDLKVLFSTNSEGVRSFRYNFAQRWVRNVFAVLYAKNNEIEKAEMVQPRTLPARFYSFDNIKKMISYFESSNHSEVEKLFISRASVGKNDYLELLGIRFAQVDMLDSALAVFKRIPDYNKQLLGNPFNGRIKDCHDCDHMAKQKVKYTSRSFIEKMIEMKNKAIADPKESANNYFLVANGFYNMSYFGNARVFYTNNIETFSSFQDYSGNVTVLENNNTLALKYYLLAKQNSSDKEFRSKCTFMAAKCEQNEWFLNKPYNYDGDFKSGQYFRMLKKEFSATKYYQEIIKECSYFQKFVKL